MKFIDLVNQRHSVRKYKQKPVPRDLIDQCLEAARLAPSARNSQPWSFLVIDDPQKISQLSKTAFTGIYKNTCFAGKAPVLIVAITEKADYITRLGNRIRNTQYSLIDIGIAGEHLVLQATELGLGTCWIGWFNAKKIKKVLNLPRSTRIDVLFSIGYPLHSECQKAHRRRPLTAIRQYI